MTQAIAMFVGLLLAFFALIGHASGGTLGLAVLGATCGVLVAWRLGLFRNGDGATWFAPVHAGAALLEAPRVVKGGLAMLRAALAGDVTIKPGLVRVRTRSSGRAQNAFASLVSAAPGAVVVHLDEHGCLVHVQDEDAADTKGWALIDARCANVAGQGTEQ